jgi:hypothetical protein
MAAVSIEHKRKSKYHGEHIPRDGATGMSASTKRHFERVKQKMFAFVGRQQTFEADGMHFQPPPPHHFHHPQPFFADQNKAPRQRSHHHTPQPPRKQLPNIAFATPQIARRGGKPSSSADGKLPAKVVRF